MRKIMINLIKIDNGFLIEGTSEPLLFTNSINENSYELISDKALFIEVNNMMKYFEINCTINWKQYDNSTDFINALING